MKKIKFKIILAGSLAAMVTLYACKKNFLEKAPLGTLDESVLATNAGVQGLLIGAYSTLDGFGNAGGGFYSGPSNWAFAGVASDDAYKGSDAGDQANEANPLENYTVTSTNSAIAGKWAALYDGITRANDVLRVMAKATGITEEDQKNIAAQARFLRGHFHFDAKRIFNNVPYVDETITYAAGNYNVANTRDIWADIENDFRFAVENLPELQDAVGRANKSAAKAYLAKVYMYQKKYAEAKPLFDDVIATGQTSVGKKYDLVKFAENFNAETENNAESVFAVQHSVNEGGGGNNSGWSDVLNFPYNNGTGDMPGGCCGFYQPSQDLVNAYRVDENGLPFLTSWFSKDVRNDQGLTSNQPFTPETDPLDSRLDWTVGRRGIPYLDWGPHPGQKWIRDQSNGGPYSPIKNVFYKAQQGKFTDVSFWTSGVVALNYNIIRFADVLLMAAEAEVELGSLERAKELVNRVRARAADPGGWVKKSDGTPAANYKVGLYTAFPSPDYARNAVRFERRLELAMEGHRFFDLVRWGIAAETLNAYIAREKGRRTYLANATFTANRNEFFPIPQGEIDITQGALEQNPGY
jgi:tetratricopeptide (TPR) repeat protein